MKNLALIGNGRWGQNFIKESEYIEGCQIKYVRGRDFSDLMNLYKGDIDGVIIATPATTHLDVSFQFGNKPMLIEKPLVVTQDALKYFFDQKIMVGHTYVYHNAVQDLKGENIRYLTFKLFNTENYGSDTSALWELGPHGVSICYYLFGNPDKILAKKTENNNIEVTFFYQHTTCHLSFGWNSNHKQRYLSTNLEPQHNVLDEATGISPLENEIREFLSFIDIGHSLTGLDHARAVTMLLSQIENIL